MRELCKIKIWEEYPSRLSENLISVQQAGSPADVASALKILLSKRENDSLEYCIWDNCDIRNGLRNRELTAMNLSDKFFLEEETLQTMSNPHNIVSSKARTLIDDEDDQVNTAITMNEKMQIDRIRKKKERSDRENKAGKKITQFMRRLLFRLKVQNLSERILIQISKERKEEKNKVFEPIRITNKRCGIGGVQFKEWTTGFLFPTGRHRSNDFEPFGLLQPLSLSWPKANHEIVQQVKRNESQKKLMTNQFALVHEHPSLFKSQNNVQEAKQECREEHENDEKHKEMVKLYQHFRFRYMQEIADAIVEIRSFIQQYKLGTAELVEEHFKEETYNIRYLCRQRCSVETKIESIIKGCDWQNEKIWGEVQEMVRSYHIIKDYVETEACKKKERSEKQREADLAKNKQEILDDDMDAIEPVVDEPKERRPKGRGKRKSQRR